MKNDPIELIKAIKEYAMAYQDTSGTLFVIDVLNPPSHPDESRGVEGTLVEILVSPHTPSKLMSVVSECSVGGFSHGTWLSSV